MYTGNFPQSFNMPFSTIFCFGCVNMVVEWVSKAIIIVDWEICLSHIIKVEAYIQQQQSDHKIHCFSILIERTTKLAG